MQLPQVKICGLTRATDVRHAVAAGADALGFVHHAPSPRHVERARLIELLADAPAHLWTVLVLVDSTPEAALDLCAVTGAGCVQLCGSEDVALWRDCPLPILRRIPVDDDGRAQLERWQGVACGFVLDHPIGPGGSGRTVSPELAAELAAAAPCLLAGGLDPDNVGRRIEAVRPRGVDASSRLECAPGEKDHARVERFIQTARRAFAITA
ncbi:MAG: phosphoribosylanthranilate isomerase [Chlamydiales bacterium]|jgi:phosphoribosylanthranilate isomerase